MAVVSQDTLQIKELLHLLTDQLKRTNTLTSESIRDIKPQAELSATGIKSAEKEPKNIANNPGALEVPSSRPEKTESTASWKSVYSAEDAAAEESGTPATVTNEPALEVCSHDESRCSTISTREVPIVVQPAAEQGDLGSGQDAVLSFEHGIINETKSEPESPRQQDSSTTESAKVPGTVPAATSRLLQRPEQASHDSSTRSPRSRSPSPGSRKRATVVPGKTLFQAARAGHKTIFLQILKNGAQIIETEVDGTTVLQAAVECNHEDIALALLFYGADPNAGGGYYKSPLLAAINKGHKQMVPILLEAGADPNTPGALLKAIAIGDVQLVKLLLKAGAAGTTVGALHYAIFAQSLEILDLLLNIPGQNINAMFEDGSTNIAGTPLQVASSINVVDMVRYLLEKKADPNMTRPNDYLRYRQSPLHAAVYHQNAEMTKLLLRGGADLTNTPGVLHWATERGAAEVVDLLLDAGLDINSHFDSDTIHGAGTPLQVAASVNNIKLVGHLLEKKADPNITRPNDSLWHRQSPLHATVYHQNTEMMRLLLSGGADPTFVPSVLHRAAERGAVEMIGVLLEAGLDINSSFDSGTTYGVGTPLQIAASANNIKLVEYLLEKKADPNVTRPEDYLWLRRSPLHAAVAAQNPALFRLLVDSGAVVTTPPGLIHYAAEIGNLDILKIILDTDVDIDEVYGNKGTATYVAAEKGRRDVLKCLLDQGADPQVEGGWYKTPLGVAIAKGHEDCVEELLGNGNEEAES
jgi:ankyrin repeat protein